MPKISELNPLTSLSNDDLVPVVNDPNGSPSNNKVTFKNFANSVLNYFNTNRIFEIIPYIGNVAFSNTTISTKDTEQNLILSSQNGNVVISPNYNFNWTFDAQGAFLLTSPEYGNVIAFGLEMGPAIISVDSLFTFSQYSNTITNEYLNQGSLSYPGSYQVWTEYSNSESNSYRSTNINLDSSKNSQTIGLNIFDGSNVNDRYWEFDKNGNLNLPDGGIISDSFPIYKARALEEYDQITWNSTTITFDNASSAELRNVLALLQAGDRISFDGTDTTVVTPYTGGTDGTIIVNGNYSIADVQLFELPDRRNLIDGIRLKTSSANTWSFGVDGVLTLPSGGDIVNSTGTSVLTTISNFGEGFSLTASDKIVTNKLYSTNEAQPLQHYRLTLDTNGVVHLPDESIINGAYIRTVPGSYAGLAAGPNSEHSEDSWMWVDNGGSWIATDYSNNAFTWQFDNNGDLILPRSSIISETANTLVLTPPNAVAGQSLVIRPTQTWSLTSDHPEGFAPGDTIIITFTPNIGSTGSWSANYTFTGCTQQQLGRSLTGTLVYSSEETKTLSWTIPNLSDITTFTFTIENVAFYLDPDPFITLTRTGSISNEPSHIHLLSGNTITTDLYLGDDDQYVKIEKNSGNVVIGTSTNTKNWTFDNNGILTLPVGGDILNSSGGSVINNLEIDGGNASTNYTAEITVDGGGA